MNVDNGFSEKCCGCCFSLTVGVVVEAGLNIQQIVLTLQSESAAKSPESPRSLCCKIHILGLVFFSVFEAFPKRFAKNVSESITSGVWAHNMARANCFYICCF